MNYQALNQAVAPSQPVLKVGDTVAIRGDLRLRMDGSCQYTPEQLVDGKYLKHTGHGGIWTGKVSKICGDEALVGGGWRHVSSYEIVSV